jgi:putative hydrolase of the HAD superfamily
MPPSFLYFDLGNVLLYFSHEQGIRQMAEVAGVDVARVREAVYDVELQTRYERGELTGRQYYDIFCQRTDTRPDFDRLARAAGDIFTVNTSIKPILSSLAAAGQRLGLLSNTCDIHWNHLADGRYATIPDIFETVVLSYKVGAVKPEPKIFQAAAEMACVAPGEIFFVDDIPGHVAAARAADFDAVQYTTTPALVADLRQRGVRFNY